MAVAHLAHIATAIFAVLIIILDALKGHHRYHFVNELSQRGEVACRESGETSNEGQVRVSFFRLLLSDAYCCLTCVATLCGGRITQSRRRQLMAHCREVESAARVRHTPLFLFAAILCCLTCITP